MITTAIIFICAYTFYRLVLLSHFTAKSLKNKVALVTGSAHGIGRELCISLAKEGCLVACVDIDSKSNENTKSDAIKNVQGEPHSDDAVKIEAFTCDLTSKEQVQEMARQVYGVFGQIDILINNAGHVMSGPLIDHSDEEIQHEFDINIMSHFWMVKSFLPDMLKRDTGHIVATASISSKIPVGAFAPYTASKCAVFGLMASLKHELSAVHGTKNIKLTTVCPFAVSTRLVSDEFKNMRINRLHLSSPLQCAEAIIEGIKLELPWFTVPRYFWWAIPAVDMLPGFLINPILEFFSCVVWKYAAIRVKSK